ncbi:hypothetical protein KI387_009358, partial [Taxus chinensis]
QGVRSKIHAPMRNFLRTPNNLVEWDRRLILVAAIEKSKLNVPKSIQMWGLKHSRNAWMELEQTPHPLYPDFIRVSENEEVEVDGFGDTEGN